MGKLLGVIRYGGKLGQTVGYKGANGKRLVRARVEEISNPRSIGQNIQRMVFSTAAVSLGHLSEILRSSVEGVKAGAPSLAYLRGKALNMLRTSDIMQGNAYRYALKGSSDFVVNPYQISKGSLSPVVIGNFSTLESGLRLGITADSSNPMEAKTFSDVFPSVSLGDQITLIQVALEIGTNRAMPFYCRFAAKTNDVPFLMPVQVGGVTYWVINVAALDLTKCAGNWKQIEFYLGTDNEIFISPKLEPDAFESDVDVAYGIIVSNRETGKRSTSFLELASDIASVYPWNADVAAPTYGNVTTSVDVAYEEYCDNSTSVAAEQPAQNIELKSVLVQGTEQDTPLTAVNGVYSVPKGSTVFFTFSQPLRAGKFSMELDAGATGITMNSPVGDEIAVTISEEAAGSFHFKFTEPRAVLGFCQVEA